MEPKEEPAQGISHHLICTNVVFLPLQFIVLSSLSEYVILVAGEDPASLIDGPHGTKAGPSVN